ncbi:DUF1003 domain-containing protein [Azospirillum sp. TSO22-1]|uniref:DUF1003 domain-containing protein n=1 Tax=Azospirillum sp. TSO22-1 TaxID=716789 RepID=UPI000D61FDAF|nr:DUF1003 domain-containing protein [Azospirillum sp. TSO22-1]PWC41437.1 hypothetical protein TSO221_23265 [Azospirillum sp. TSO22-1]
MDEELRHLAEEFLSTGYDSLNDRERKVISHIARRHHVAQNVSHAFEEKLTFGDRLADKVAAIGGSWAFVSGFGLLIVTWTIINSGILIRFGDQFDPYPYVFLNLILSMLAALQAPVIMMSQNRQAAKDRLADGLDYEVNLKAEVEIMRLHEKLDHLRIDAIIGLLDEQKEQVILLRRAMEAKADTARGSSVPAP